MSPAQALETFKSYHALNDSIGHIDIYRRRSSKRKIVCLVYNTGHGLWYWRRRHKHTRPGEDRELGPVFLNELPENEEHRRRTWRTPESWPPYVGENWPAAALTAITRRAFVPRTTVQLYQQHPRFQSLLNSRKRAI